MSSFILKNYHERRGDGFVPVWSETKQIKATVEVCFVAGLPTEVATQLKSIVAREKLELTEIVMRAHRMLAANGKTSVSCAVDQKASVICQL